MRVWVDGQCLQTATRLRGIGRYVSDFVRALAAHTPTIELSISFNAALPDEAIVARDLVSAWIDPGNIHVWQGVAENGEAIFGHTSSRRLSELALAHHVACLNPDIALCASPFEGAENSAVPLLATYGHSFRLVSLFFDAIPMRFPDRYLKTRRNATYYHRRLRALQNCDALLAISEFAKNEADELIPGPKAVRIDAGVSSDLLSLVDLPPDPAAIGALGLNEPFVLYVGALDWRKNVTGVVHAFRLLPPDLSHSLHFVVVGDRDPSLQAELTDAWLDRHLSPDNLHILGYVTPEILVRLYKQCEVAIQPSRMEGFGLTALEAMACGTPVIGAASGALPEVIGNQEALFDPSDPEDIAAKLKQVVTNRELRAQLTARGLKQARKFSWERSAQLAIQEFDRVLAGAPHNERRSASSTLNGFAGPREITARSARGLRRHALAAPILALAEPAPSHEPKLLVDVTSTCRHDAGTGIQRVVKQTAAALIASRAADEPSVDLSCWDLSPGLWRARLVGDPMKLEKCPSRTRLAPHPGDILLMLDSSWDFWRQHKRVFRQARLTGCEVYSTLYDTVPLKAPAFCRDLVSPIFSDWFRVALAYSSGFVCISRTVADELLRLLEAIKHPRPVKVGYWHLGGDFASKRTALPRWAEACPKPVFLMVGTIEPRKGYRVALDAFSALWREGFGGSLCIVGKSGWGTEQLIAHMRSHPEFGRKLCWAEGVSDGELQALYASCTALIAASYLEGFGLPLAEASYHNKPIIASDIPVFREVVAGAERASFFRVGCAESLAMAVKEFAGNSEIREQVSGKRISWMESALELKRVILGGEWYRVYEPRNNVHKFGQPGFTNGEIAVREAFDADARRHRLEFIGAPTVEKNGRTLKFTIKVSNLSNRAWSSVTGHDRRYGVSLGYRVLNSRGNVLAEGTSRATIPFVLPPEDHHYLALEIDPHDLERTAGFIEFELLQEGVQWWGNPLRVAIDGVKPLTEAHSADTSRLTRPIPS